MDSHTLSLKGFERWQNFNLKAEAMLAAGLPSFNGVYAIINDVSFGRFVGESDIVFIGSASGENGLRGRILEYINPGPAPNPDRRINGILHLHPGLKLSYVLIASAENAHALETSLLNEYERQHGELPPANRRE